MFTCLWLLAENKTKQQQQQQQKPNKRFFPLNESNEKNAPFYIILQSVNILAILKNYFSISSLGQPHRIIPLNHLQLLIKQDTIRLLVVPNHVIIKHVNNKMILCHS